MNISIKVLTEFSKFANGPPQIDHNLYGEGYKQKQKEYLDEYHNLSKRIKNKYNAFNIMFTDEYGSQHYMIFEDSSAIKFNYGVCHIMDGIDCPFLYDDIKDGKITEIEVV